MSEREILEALKYAAERLERLAINESHDTSVADWRAAKLVREAIRQYQGR